MPNKGTITARISGLLLVILASQGPFAEAIDPPSLKSSETASSIYDPGNPAGHPSDYTEMPDWRRNALADMAAGLQQDDVRKYNVVFVGDSITKNWLCEGKDIWENTFNGGGSRYNSLNLGVGGDQIQNILRRIQPAKPGPVELGSGGGGALDNPALNPSVFVVMAGVNNCFGGYTSEQIQRGVEVIVKSLLIQRPQSRIVVCSVLPLKDAKTNNEVIRPANSALKTELQKNKKHSVVYLDLYQRFIGQDGKGSTALYNPDGTHLSRAGYEVWAEELLPVLEKMAISPLAGRGTSSRRAW